MGWPTARAAGRRGGATQRQTEEIARIARQLVEATNANYRQFAGSDDLGHPSAPPAGSPSLDATLDAAYARVQQQARARTGVRPRRAGGPSRCWPACSSTTSTSRASTSPGRARPTTTGSSRAPDLPHTVAHEKAHQRGFAQGRRGELHRLPRLRDERRSVRALLGLPVRAAAAARRARAGATRQGQAIEPGPARAGACSVTSMPSVAFWQQYVGAPSRVSAAVNDTYLRSQGERRGIAAYAASRSLIVLFARHNGGSAVVDAAPQWTVAIRADCVGATRSWRRPARPARP